MYESAAFYQQIETPVMVAAPALNLAAPWVAAVIAAGGTVSSGRRALVEALLDGLSADGVLTLLDRLWILAAENTQSALIDLVALVTATPNGSPTFTTDRGYTGVDASATIYIETHFSPSANGVQFTQNSGHISAWSNTNTQSTVNGGCIMGCTFQQPQSNIIPWYSDGSSRYRLNDQGFPAGVFAPTPSSLGHFLANRPDSTHASGYRNGALDGAQNDTTNPLPSDTFYVLAGNSSNGGGTPVVGLASACQITMASVGAGFTTTQITSFYNRLRTYMTAVGVS